MRIAFGIVSLFPGGGLQRDCLEILDTLRGQGHDVTLFASRILGNIRGSESVKLLPNRAYTNHQRNLRFSRDFAEATSGNFDRTVGFDKIHNVDVLYCADPSIKFRLRHKPFLRLLPRYSTLIDLEQFSFAPGSKTRILLLNETQLEQYRTAWNTEPDRMTLLPPAIAQKRRRPVLRMNGTRASLRKQLNLTDDDLVWLAIGVQPKTKGLDRTVRALTEFPDARVVVVGLDRTSQASADISLLAKQLGVENRVTWLGHREDIPELMAAADLLVHPARHDTTGTVILEAIVNGLPVVTTTACGYAAHVRNAKAGIAVDEPFDSDHFVSALGNARDASLREAWSASAIDYGQKQPLYQGRNRAAEIIAAS